MREMTREEKMELIEMMSAKRTRIKEKVGDLTKKRAAFIAKEREKLALEDTSFDGVISKAIREQASARGFMFPESPKISSVETTTDAVGETSATP
jgi:hypothetical protein